MQETQRRVFYAKDAMPCVSTAAAAATVSSFHPNI